MNTQRLTGAILCLTSILLFVLVYGDYTPARIFFTNDLALSLAVGKTALTGVPVMLGPPSHIGGRHLGAAYYWYVSLTEFLAGGDTFFSLKLFSCWKVLALLLTCSLTFLVLEKRWRWWAALGALLTFCSPGYISILRTAWHNHFLVVPAAFAWLSALAVFKLRYAALPIFALCASLLLQSHFSTLPTVAGLALMMFAFLWHEDRRQVFRKILSPNFAELILYVIALLSWAPLLLYELSFPGSFAELLRAKTHAAGSPAGLGAAVREMFNFWWLVLPGSKLVYGALTPLLFVPLALRAWRGDVRVRFALIGIFFVLGFYLLSLARISAPLYASYLFGLLPVPGLLIGISLASALALENENPRAGTLRWISLLCCLAMLAIWFKSLVLTTVPGREREFAVYNSFAAAEEVAGFIRADNGDAPPLVLHARNQCKSNRDAILFFLGPSYYNQMQYWNWLKELPQWDSVLPGQAAYLASCPRMYSAAIRDFERDLGEEWNFSRAVDLSKCKSCKDCLLRRYERK